MMGMNQAGTVTLTAALVAVLSVVAVTIGTPLLVDTIDVQPDHPLYALDRAGESIKEVFVSGQSWEIERAQERDSEFVYTVGIGKSGEYKWLIEEAEEHLIHAAKLAEDNEGLQRAIEANKNHIIVLESVKNRVPVEIRLAISWAQLQGCVSTSVLRDIAGREEIYPIIPGSLKVELGDRLDEIAVGIESLRVGNLQPPEIIVGAENFEIVLPPELVPVLENWIIWPSENVIHIENITYVISPIENIFEVENVTVAGLRIRVWEDNNPENAEAPQSDGIKSQYDGFFLTGIPIYNTYTFSDPENPPDKVDFIMITEKGENVQPEDNWVTDDNEWKAKFNMGELEPNPTLRVVVYRGSSKEPLQRSVTILETPEWLNTLLLDNASDVSFENKASGDNRYWVMEVETESINTIESRFDALIDYIGGIYSLNTPAMRTHFEISSDTEVGIDITFLDIEMEDAVSVKIPYGKAEAKYRLKIEIVGQVRVSESDIVWKYGRFYVDGRIGTEFDVRVRVIPFIAEAGLRGGFWSDASFNFSLVPSEDGSDEWLLLPGIAANGVGEMGVGARASLYAEVLCGVAGVEGGLGGAGGMTIQLPEENSEFFLEYKIWARAWFLIWSWYWDKTGSWNSEIETVIVQTASENLPSRFRYENVENFEVSMETLGNTGMELLVEKPYPFPSPSVAINQRGDGIIVWTDENMLKDPCQAFEIFYSYYDPDDGDWIGAEPITSDEFMDFDSVATSLKDGRMMAVWNRSSEVLSPDADIKQALGRSKLTYSIWDPSARTWSEPELMTNDKCFGTGKTLTRIENEVLLTYVLDADNDPFTLEGNSLWCMTWDGSTWSEPERLAENLTIISVPRLAMVDENNGGLVFLNDGDDNLRTLEDRTISLIRFADGGWEEIKTVRVGGEINDPWVTAIDNQLYLTWIEETAQEDNSELDSIYISEIDLGRAEISPPRVVMENTIIGCQQFLTDGTRLLLVYQTGENNTPYLLKHEEGIWKQEGRLAYNGRYKQLSVDASNGRLVTAAVRPMTKTIGLETKLARSDLYVSMLKEFGKPEGE